MKVIKTLVLVALLAISVQIAFAEETDEGRWDVVFMNPNQGNKFYRGDVGSDGFMIALGTLKDSQGSTSMVLKKSTDGGRNFSDIQIESNGGMMQMFTEVEVIDKNTAFLVGTEIGIPNPVGGPVWKLTNSGGSSQMQVVIWGEFPTCSRIHCNDASHCWLGCMEGLVAYTTNGGEDWETAHLPETDLTPGGMFFIDNTTGWLRAYKTEETPGPGENDPPIVTYLERGATFKTTDGGKNWTKITTGGEAYSYNNLFMVDSQLGFADAFDGTRSYLMRTTDGGQNWFILPIPPTKPGQFGDYPLYAIGGIHFFDENTGWVAASYGEEETGIGSVLIMYKTGDGGNNWTPYNIYYIDANTNEDTIMPGVAYDLAFVDEHRGYAFGELQMIAEYDDGQYVDPEDGDTPDGDAPDGDGGGEDGDVDTGPIYTGAPGEPCPVPGSPDSYDLPRCDPEQGAPLCAWATDYAAHCTDSCEFNADCRKFGPDSCCKMVSLEGAQTGICIIDYTHCQDHPETWYGYDGALLGEACYVKNQAAWASYPKCDPNYGGDFCVLEPDVGGPTFCSMPCTSDADCVGGFTEEGCCTGISGETSYCRFGERCNPDWEPEDGDEPSDGDVTIPVVDGDVPSDGDSPEDGDDDGSGVDDGDGGGCAGAAGGPLVLLALCGLAILRRRRR